jgi:ATP-dependent helicase/nuclease subunit B
LIRLPTELNEVIEQGGTVVVPSRQRAYAARLAYSATQFGRGRRVWATPDILPVDAWLTREVERYAATGGTAVPRLLSPAEEWFLWRQCAAQATSELGLVNRSALAEALRRASSIAADFGIDVRKAGPGLENEQGAETVLLAEVQRAVDERCQSLRAVPVASLVGQLRPAANERPVVCSGFLTLPPRLRSLVAPLQETGSALPASPNVIIAADELDELERIAQWCRAQVEHKSDVRILITLPGAAGTRERLATLIRQAIYPGEWLGGPGAQTARVQTESLVAIEGGAPLAHIPAVAHALATLSWLGSRAGDFEAVSGWLCAPYWRTPEPISRAQLDLWLRERERMHFDLHELAAALQSAPSALAPAAREISAQINKAAEVLAQGTASPRDWSERFRAALAVFGWPGEHARSSGEQQTVVRFYELLDELGQLASAARSISRDNAIQWFTELAARTAFRPADDDAVITISSVFAAPVVRYDAIWIGGLRAEAFPQPVQPDPFIPLAAQLAAGVPAASAGGRLSEAHALLSSWRLAADELVLSAPARSQDLELLPSPLLAEWLPMRSVSAGETGSIWLPTRLHREGMLETLDDAVGLGWPVEQPLPSGTRSLELQNQCPFRAYAELRLGSTPLDAPKPGIAPDVRGQLLHAALQKLWRRLGDSHALSALSDTALDAAIHECVEEAASQFLHTPAMSRECRRAKRLIRALCAVERERTPFSVESTELDSTLTLKDAHLRVRIDRVDTLESGGRAILDYKSGARTTADWYGERPSHPQLLAYLAALGDDVVAMATVNVTAREVRFDGIANSPGLLPRVKGVEAALGTDPNDAWPARRQEWLSRIEHLAADFLAGRAVVDPKPDACDYCHVASVCRIADRIEAGGGEATASEAGDE